MISYFALYGVVFMLGILLLMLQKKKTLTASQKKKFILYLAKIEKIDSPSEQIVQTDKLYHNILKGYGYSGTFGDILKKEPSIIPSIQTIWDLHKLRNEIVHDLGHIPESKLEKFSHLYIREVRRILQK